MDYICNHIMRTAHTQIRWYKINEEGISELLYYYGDSLQEDIVCSDQIFTQQLLSIRSEEYPILYAEKYPIYFAVICQLHCCFILGPVNVEQQQIYYEGMTVERYLAQKHNVRNTKVPYCKYENFCQEVLLLFYMMSGREMSYVELNEKNYITESLLASMQIKKSELFFNYHEHSRVHNPYELEARTMEGIRKGDVERVIKSLDETFTGEYGILSKSSLQSAKNLGIIGLTLASRAAIGGGMPYEKAFSLHDSQVLRLEEINNIGEVEVMIRQSKIQYAEMVHELRSGCDRKKNLLIEECKNLIFRKMHTKIIIRELADELEVSVEYLSALFRKTEGICIKDYITKEKVQLAENMLIYSQYSIEQIALYLGFNSQSHFGSVFKKHENMTPKQYRDNFAKKM